MASLSHTIPVELEVPILIFGRKAGYAAFTLDQLQKDRHVFSAIIGYIANWIASTGGALVVISSANSSSASAFADHVGTLMTSIVQSTNTFRATVDGITGEETRPWSSRLDDVALSPGSPLPVPAKHEIVVVIATTDVLGRAVPLYHGPSPFLIVDLDTRQAITIL